MSTTQFVVISGSESGGRDVDWVLFRRIGKERILFIPMEYHVRASGYRCFRSKPLEIPLQPGFTAFVGPNNSGKSAALRLFQDCAPALISFPTQPGNVPGFLNNPGVAVFGQSVLDPTEAYTQGDACPFKLSLSWKPSLQATLPGTVCPDGIEYEVPIEAGNRAASRCWLTFREGPRKELRGPVTMAGDHSIYDGPYREDAGPPRVDVQPLTAVVDDMSNLMYVPAPRFVYGGSQVDSRYLFGLHVGTAFIRQWHERQTGLHNKAEKNLVANLEKEIARLARLERLSIRAVNDLSTLEMSTEHGSFRLDEVGGGITQMLVILGNAAFRRPSWILIDEPELGLHPSLQQDFLTTLASYAKHGIVFATHSLGLARSVADRIFAFEQNNGTSTVELVHKAVSIASLADALTFGWRDLISDCVIVLAEGPSEVRIFERWLITLGKTHRFVVVGLGGSSVIRGNADEELKQFKRLGAQVVAIVDSDREIPGGDAKRDPSEFQACCQRNGVDCHLTERRCVESYLSARAVHRAFPTIKFAGFGPYDKIPDSLPWGKKICSWRVACAMTRDEILETDLGRVLNSL